MIGMYRQKLIELLIEEEGGVCRYCSVLVRRNWMETERHPHDATIDHIIPRSKGGTNERPNLALACNRCNNIKADRDLEDFLRSPHYLRGAAAEPKVQRSRNVKFVRVPPEIVAADQKRRREEKTTRGTLAHMLQHGDGMPLPRGATLKNAPATNRIPAPKMSALETARWLRECARKNGQKWPLA